MTLDLDLFKLLDSWELVETYQRVRLFSGDELALELVKILKSVNSLKHENEALRGS